MSPYREAFAWIAQAPDSDSARGLAKLILSLSSARHPFSLADCLRSITGPQIRLAMRVANHYAEHGEDDELQAVVTEVCRLFPKLVQLGQVMTEAARQLAREWLHDHLADAARRQPAKDPDDE